MMITGRQMEVLEEEVVSTWKDFLLEIPDFAAASCHQFLRTSPGGLQLGLGATSTAWKAAL